MLSGYYRDYIDAELWRDASKWSKSWHLFIQFQLWIKFHIFMKIEIRKTSNACIYIYRMFMDLKFICIFQEKINEFMLMFVFQNLVQYKLNNIMNSLYILWKIFDSWWFILYCMNIYIYLYLYILSYIWHLDEYSLKILFYPIRFNWYNSRIKRLSRARSFW